MIFVLALVVSEVRKPVGRAMSHIDLTIRESGVLSVIQNGG